MSEKLCSEFKWFVQAGKERAGLGILFILIQSLITLQNNTIHIPSLHVPDSALEVWIQAIDSTSMTNTSRNLK